ncbi:MAG: hypothetical protein OQL19_19795 [Gammaproteobacteria bacterium]|nr:hypothetical protein [Gammaproteobacteria bacterium]
MIINNSTYVSMLSQASSTENRMNIEATGGNNLPVENYSRDSVQISEAAKSKNLQNITGLVHLADETGMYKLGVMALGSKTIQEWSAKGLDISNEAVIAAGQAFQDGFNKAIRDRESSLAGSNLSINKHQILINHQEVPDWFMHEYENKLSSIDDKNVKNAFESGELFYSSKPSVSKVHALASYASVEKSI